MTGRILIVDDVATNRIVMKVKLTAACYAVDQASSGTEALTRARETRPDLILLDVVMPDLSGLEVCRRLKADPRTTDIPVILVTSVADHESKMTGLAAGADDFLTKPVDEVTLLARVRSSLRNRDIVRELQERGKGTAVLGFAEAAAGFDHRRGGATRAGKVALVSASTRTALPLRAALARQTDAEISVMTQELALAAPGDGTAPAPDVFVLGADLADGNAGLRLLSDLRSRPQTRDAATVMILPEGERDRAAIALDLGASDILYDPFDPRELAIRLEAQLHRKARADQLRASLLTGLEMAVTDSLTGLHNRRYGLFQLDRILARRGRELAVMMLDLDFFKAVNDRHGHAAGDQVLAQVAQRLRGVLRDSDLLARIGGEEFLVCLPDTGHDAALSCAEALRHAIAQTPFQVDIPGRAEKRHITVTLSVGLAIVERGGAPERADALIDRADRALYLAKADGRDQVMLAGLPAA